MTIIGGAAGDEGCTRVHGRRTLDKLRLLQLLSNKGLKWEWKP